MRNSCASLATPDACNPAWLKAASVVYFITSLGFGIRLLVNHKIIDPFLYFSHHSSSNLTDTAIIAIDAAVVCCLGSTAYGVFAAMGGFGTWQNTSRYLNKIADGIFYSFLLSAIVHFNDFIPVFLLVACYLSFQLELYDILNAPKEYTITVGRRVSLSILCLSFWTSILMGMIHNVQYNRPGAIAAQLFSMTVCVTDLYNLNGVFKTFNFTGEYVIREGVDFICRFLMLVCVYVETV